MDPKEWQRLAEEVAVESRAALDEVESEFWPEPSDPSFRSFWPRIRSLSEKLRTAPAIDIEVKLALLQRIRQLTKRAREDQEVFFVQQRHRKQEILDSVAELHTQIEAQSRPDELRRLRQDVVALRDTVTGVELPARGDRQEVWAAWQRISQEVWDRLNRVWKENEAQLTEFLEQARIRLDRGNVREARDLIRQFNATSREREVSHKSSRVLRARANGLWREAGDVAQAKHETFIATAPHKMERWKEVRGRNAKAIARIRAEIADLESAAEQTGIGAAFAKAMMQDKVRELKRLEETNESLEGRIESTEAALTPEVEEEGPQSSAEVSAAEETASVEGQTLETENMLPTGTSEVEPAIEPIEPVESAEAIAANEVSTPDEAVEVAGPDGAVDASQPEVNAEAAEQPDATAKAEPPQTQQAVVEIEASESVESEDAAEPEESFDAAEPALTG